jgi:UTP:GlnB (protein PII) uridylyltransferase
MKINNPKTVAGITLPDSTIARQATELLLEHGTEFLYNHSIRSFIFAALNGQQKQITHDAELLFVSAVFHDLGLTPHYRSEDKRFEVDGADAARDFLRSHGLSSQALQLVWDTIALHTSPGIAEYKEAEVALLNYGVALDVVGRGYSELSEKNRQEILNYFPRNNFKNTIIPTFYEGFKHKPDTTFGSINADICTCMNPDFHPKNFCDAILNSPWID